MRAEKAFWYRPAYGYAAAAVCVALAAWGAANPPPTLGIVQALGQTDRDTQLPLERFAVEAGNPAASSVPALRRTEQPLPHRSTRREVAPAPQDRRVSGPARDRKAGTDAGLARRSAPRREHEVHEAHDQRDQHADYRTIENWKNWT